MASSIAHSANENLPAIEGFESWSHSERQTAWFHARDAFTVPEFVPLGYLIQNCATVDLMILERETLKSSDRELIALADLWILGFFDILSIVCAPEYRKFLQSGVTAELAQLKKRTNCVRASFGKLQIPGRKKYVFPSHSGLSGAAGIVYSVYDDQHNEIDIRRHELVASFLDIALKLPPSARFAEWISRAD